LAIEQSEPLVCSSQTEDSEHQQQLFTLLYEELRRLAQRRLRNMGPSLTLGATTLLHEVYLDMQHRQGTHFPDRAHFFAYAGRAMRGVIIDYARSGQTLKRGGAFEITSLPPDVPDKSVDVVELQALSDAIERLAVVEPRLAQVVDLKYFSGFSPGDIATMWGVSERTVHRDWEKARLFLRQCLDE